MLKVNGMFTPEGCYFDSVRGRPTLKDARRILDAFDIPHAPITLEEEDMIEDMIESILNAYTQNGYWCWDSGDLVLFPSNEE
jgi:hypothetical protein